MIASSFLRKDAQPTNIVLQRTQMSSTPTTDCAEAPEESSSSPITLPPTPEKPYLAAVKSVAVGAAAPPVQCAVVTTPGSTCSAIPPWKSTFGSFSAMERGDTLSSAASHDRIETMSNQTSHMEMESVVSSWVDDDDYFMQSALHDIQIMQQQQQQQSAAGKGWKVANSNSNSSGGGRQQRGSRRQRQQPPVSPSTATVVGGAGAPVAPPQSGGRFDALYTEPRRRR